MQISHHSPLPFNRDIIPCSPKHLGVDHS